MALKALDMDRAFHAWTLDADDDAFMPNDWTSDNYANKRFRRGCNGRAD